MPFEYLEHEADIGILVSADSVEKAFEDGAKAMFNVMVDIEKVEEKNRVEIECRADDINGLFIEWLNELLLQKDLTDNVFSNFKIVEITKNDNYRLKGEAYGEPINSERHSVGLEVKAATYSGLKSWQEGDKFYFRCLVDV